MFIIMQSITSTRIILTAIYRGEYQSINTMFLRSCHNSNLFLFHVWPWTSFVLVCFSVVGGLEASPGSWPLWWMWPIRILSSIPAKDCSNSGPEIKCGSLFPSSSWWVSRMLAQCRCNHCTERTTVLFVYWVQAHLNNSCYVKGLWKTGGS